MHEVKTEADKKAFLQVAVDIYANDPNWIRPLNKDIEEVFDPTKNKFIKRGGEYIRWLLRDDNGRHVGRIAAFVNKTYKQDQPTGGIGFFECDNNYEHAAMMFDHCKAWLQERGMEAMDGPINFGERDKWWGLLTDGFYPPLYGLNYNPPYYQALFERYGFLTYFNQVCFALQVRNKLEQKFYDRHAMYKSNPEYTASKIDKGNLDKYVKDFTTIYNKAWAGHGGGKELEEKTVAKMFKTMKPVMDENIVWFAYHRGAPIAMWINIPDLNQYFKHMNGKFGILQKLQFLWLKMFGKCNRFVGIIFGVIPEYQGKGIDSYLIMEGANVIQPMGKYEDYEMQWIGDFNPKMINIAESLGTTRSRNLRTYRYLFDRTKEFKRHRIL